MKFQGKISNWNDQKGFGFVEPNGGGECFFVHINAFIVRSRRSAEGDSIIYQLALDNNKRYRADKIQFAQHSKKSKVYPKAKNTNIIGTFFTLTFCIGLVLLVFTEQLPAVVPGCYAVMSIAAFIAYAVDKSAAQNGRWRTRESTLHLLAIAGGWPGALYARNKLRHKSNKAQFKSLYWVTVTLNIGGLFWLLTEQGALFLYQFTPVFLNG